MSSFARFACLSVVSLAACGLDVVGVEVEPALPSAVADAGANDPPPRLEETPGSEDSGTRDADDGVDGGPPDAGPYGTRITKDLVALYEFEEGAGVTVYDAIAPAYHLTIEDPAKATWRPHAIAFEDFTRVHSFFAFGKAAVAFALSKELTVEAWVVSEGKRQSDYARIVTMAVTNDIRVFSLGEYGPRSAFWGSLDEDEDLTPAKTAMVGQLTHVAITRAADATFTLWVNGQAVAVRSTKEHAFDAVPSYPLSLGNSPSSGRGWLGAIHLVAIYSRALTASELQINVAAGADP